MVTCVFPSGHPFPVLSLQLLIPERRLPLKGLHLVPYSPEPPRPHTSCPPMLSDPWDPVPPSTPVEYKSPGLEVVHFHSPASPVGTFEQAVNFPVEPIAEASGVLPSFQANNGLGSHPSSATHCLCISGQGSSLRASTAPCKMERQTPLH